MKRSRFTQDQIIGILSREQDGREATPSAGIIDS